MSPAEPPANAEVLVARIARRARVLTPPEAIPILRRLSHRALLFLPRSCKSSHHRMIPRPSGVGIAVASLLAIGSVCFAAGSDSTCAPGMGGVGGMIGGSHFAADADYSDGAQPRFAFSADFRYAVNDWLRWEVSPGVSWAGYQKDTPAPFRDLHFPAHSPNDGC